MSNEQVKQAVEWFGKYATDSIRSERFGRVLASEVTRLAALAAVTPRVWDADSIKDAPDGWYWLLENGCGVCPDAWYRPDTKSEVMKLMLHKLEGMRGIYTHAFGPIPQPPEGQPQ